MNPHDDRNAPRSRPALFAADAQGAARHGRPSREGLDARPLVTVRRRRVQPSLELLPGGRDPGRDIGEDVGEDARRGESGDAGREGCGDVGGDARRDIRRDGNAGRNAARREPDGRNGFSLLELLVVVAILGILVAAALPRFGEFRAAAYDSRSQQDLRNLVAAEELFRATSPVYAGDVAQLSGFTASEGVDVAVESADETGFVATATHAAGTKDFRWDSEADPPLSSTTR